VPSKRKVLVSSGSQLTIFVLFRNLQGNAHLALQSLGRDAPNLQTRSAHYPILLDTPFVFVPADAGSAK
jgi:hypothetical protein